MARLKMKLEVICKYLNNFAHLSEGIMTFLTLGNKTCVIGIMKVAEQLFELVALHYRGKLLMLQNWFC